MICARCHTPSPGDSQQELFNAGWACTLDSGYLCQTCYAGLCEIRDRLRREQTQTINTYMREGRPR